MASLLDLPTELLEIIIIDATRTAISFLSPLRLNSRSMRRQASKNAGPLRLVHPAIKEVVDTLVYKHFHHVVDESPTYQFDRPNGTCKILTSSPLAQNIKNLSVEFTFRTEASVDLLEHVVAILEQIGRNLNRMRLCGMHQKRQIRFLPLPQQWPEYASLRQLTLGDASFALRLPLFARGAPLLETVYLYGRSKLAYESTQTIIDKYEKACPGYYHLTRPLTKFRIRDFHMEWLQCLLANLRPFATCVRVDIGGRPKQFEASEKLLKCMAPLTENPQFRSFEMRFVTRKAESVVPKTAQLYRNTVEPLHAKLWEALKQEWKGRGIEVALDTPRADWESLILGKRVSWSELFQTIRVVT